MRDSPVGTVKTPAVSPRCDAASDRVAAADADLPTVRFERLLYSVREAAEMLSIGRVKLYELLAAGRIESVKLDGSRRIPREALEEFVRQLRIGTNSYF